MSGAGLHGAGEHPAHDSVVESAHWGAGWAQSEERRRPVRVRHHHRQADGEDGDLQRLGDELLGVQRAITDQCVERPLLPELRQVLEVVLDLTDEEPSRSSEISLGPLRPARSGNRSLRLLAMTSVARS